MSAVAASAAVLLPAARPSFDGGTVDVLPELYVPEASQWLSTSAGRIAPDGYSWMQGVHWVAGSGLYRPRRHKSHGPRSLGPTTVRVAQELAQLYPCRPGIAYLMRRTGLSERSVEYHLGMLREAGLLAYIVRGTRVRGESAQASEFARMIPVEFDQALGIRTVQRDEDAPAHTRAMTGISEAGRELMAKLAKKASRKVRKPRTKRSAKASAGGTRRGADQGSVTAVSDEVRCTPMQVGTSALPTAGTTYVPPESKLASGDTPSPTPQQQKPKARRTLNKVGRRHQLATELAAIAPWCSRASRSRLSWILRDVADAGWTALEVQAVAEDRGPLTAADVRRPSGMLAHRLKGAHLLYTTKAQRKTAVLAWQESRTAERARHDGYQQGVTNGRPTSQSVQNIVRNAFDRTRAALAGPVDDADCHLIDTTTPQTMRLEDLDSELVIAMRQDAVDPDVILSALATGMTETDARRLYTHRLVDQALTLDRLANRDLTPAF
ncbi:winged helix-turn-helix domain-containing protein [Streptomyces sp. NPDC088116]|uniref:helix-turn-helix domain-containing protein n=1 Tax=Streptomyces sp. NPDC088116 TaxID=3365825 RepID=UPI0037F485BA